MTGARTVVRRRCVFLHGLAGSVAMWDPVIARTAGLVDGFAPALPWHGTADPSWAVDAEPGRALDRFVTGDDIVVAHSFAAALLLARLAAPGAVRPAAVVLVSPFYRPEPTDFTWETLEHFLGDFHLLLARGLRAASSRTIADDLLHDMAIAVRGRVGAYGWLRFITAYLATPAVDLRSLTMPIAVLHGTDDAVAPPADGAALAARLVDASFHPVDGAGHFPMLLRPDALADVIGTVVTRLTVPPVLPVVPRPAALAVSQEVPA